MLNEKQTAEIYTLLKVGEETNECRAVACRGGNSFGSSGEETYEEEMKGV